MLVILLLGIPSLMASGQDIPLQGIALMPSSAILGVDEVKAFTVIYDPPEATHKHVSWFSADDSVVSIDTAGIARGMGSGSSFIFAVSEDGGFSDTATVKVSKSLKTSYETEQFITVNGQERRYLLFHPGRGTNMPVVLVLHGRGSTPENMRDGTGFNILANKEGFIAVYPSAIEPALVWDMEEGMAFISALVEQLKTDYNIDPNRVYATGFSAGGYLSNYLGNNLSDKIAAIAPVEAGILSPWTLAKPPRGVPVCIVHNRLDEIVPYASGIETRDRWIVWNETSSSPQQVIVHDDPPVLLETYRNGRDFSEVVFYTVEYTYYKGHTWAWKEYTGLDATGEAIWPFFNRYSLKGLRTGLEKNRGPFGIRMFPNPVTERELYLSFSADAPRVLFITIHDLAGKVLYEHLVSGHPDRDHVPVRIPELEEGFYLIRISNRSEAGCSGNFMYTGKIIIEKF